MSIFDNKDNALATGTFFSFKTIGDKIEGTYIGTGYQVSQISGEEQLHYRLKGTDGQYYKVGSRKGIDSQMKGIKLGQIIGFEYVADKDVKKPSPAKIIQVWANPSIVDTQWLKENEEAVAAAEAASAETPVKTTPAPTAFPAPASAPASAPVSTPAPVATSVNTPSPAERFKGQPFHTAEEKQDMLLVISEMAKDKLGATTPEEVKSKVMEATGIAFIDAQLPKIIEALDKLPNRN